MLIEAQEQIFRHRAERLLSDIQSISLRSTTYVEATAILAHWGDSEKYKLPCAKEHCSLSIDAHGPFNGELFSVGRLNHLYRVLGGQLGTAYGEIVVRNGIVWDETYRLELFTEDRGLVGASVSTMNFGLEHYAESEPGFHVSRLPRYPSFYIVSLSPYSSRQTLRRVMRFNLSCLTRWIHRCQTDEALLPGIEAELNESHAAFEKWSSGAGNCRPQEMRVLARDLWDVAIVDVIRNDSSALLGDQYRSITVSVVANLKGHDLGNIGATRRLEVRRDAIAAPLHSGERILLLYGIGMTFGGPHSKTFLETGACGIAPFTQENVANLEIGIGQDERVPPLEEYDRQRQYHAYFDPPIRPDI
jgi:hypothetical protein